MSIVIWVPYVAPGASAACLDDDTLASQISATAAVLRDSYEQIRKLHIREIMHVSRMWAGYPLALAIRGLTFATELSVNRSHTAKVPQDDLTYIMDIAKELEEADEPRDEPPWMGTPDIHRSHRSNLIREGIVGADEFPATPAKMPLLWPQSIGGSTQHRLRIDDHDLRLLGRGLRKLPAWLHWDAQSREVVST